MTLPPRLGRAGGAAAGTGTGIGGGIAGTRRRGGSCVPGFTAQELGNGKWKCEQKYQPKISGWWLTKPL